MKRHFSLFLTFAIAGTLLLSACGNTPTAAPETSASPESSPTTSEVAATPEPSQDILAQAATIQHDPDNYTDIVRAVSYLEDDLDYHKVDLYGTSNEEVLPVVIEVHGGAFIGGSRKTNTNHSIFFAERGYKVVATDYPGIPRDGNFTDAIQDLFTSYQWVADHADEYGFDMSNVILSGDSAGGYYVLLTCAIFHSEELQEYFGVTLPNFEFQGFVTTCPVANIRAMQEYLESEEGVLGHAAQKIGADILLDEELMSHLDLMQSVEPQAFEGVYMLTTPDDAVTGEDVQVFDRYLTENNVPHVTVSYDSVENNLVHTFNIGHTGYAESLVANQDMVDYCNSLLQ